MVKRESSDWDTTEWNSMRESLHTSSHRSSPSSNSFKLVITSPSPTAAQSEEHSALMAYEESPRQTSARRNDAGPIPALHRFGWRKFSFLMVVGLVLVGRFGTTEKWREEKKQAFMLTTSSWRDGGVDGQSEALTTLPAQAPPTPTPRVFVEAKIDPSPPIPSPISTIPHPPRFIFAGRIGEQETKAQIHLYSLGLLALILNRTLVLPTVQKSRMGGCYEHPFEFYYKKDSLEAMGIPTISQADFISWTKEQEVAPTAQVISMRHTTQGDQRQIQIDHNDQDVLHRAMCVSRATLDFDEYEPLLVHPPDGRTVTENSHTNFAKRFKEGLESGLGRKSETQEAKSADVLVFDYNLRYPLLTPPIVTLLSSNPAPLPYTYFPYSSIWTSLGTQLSSTLSPFIAIHWRVETIPARNLFPCGHALVSQLIKLKERFPELSNVYLATDYPIELLDGDGTSGMSAHSSTFTKELSEEHHEAMRSFLQEFRDKAEGMRLTSFMEEEGILHLPESLGEGERVEDADPALIGLVDKIVLTNAEVFLAGEPGKTNCAKDSSFTAQIIGGRESYRAAQAKSAKEVAEDPWKWRDGSPREGRLWNTVDRWGTSDLGADGFLESDW